MIIGEHVIDPLFDLDNRARELVKQALMCYT
jgi:hypothetical protein